MRSIGKIKIKKLKTIINNEFNKAKNKPFTSGLTSDLNHEILDQVPLEWFNTWESAHTEIHNIIDDEIFELVCK